MKAGLRLLTYYLHPSVPPVLTYIESLLKSLRITYERILRNFAHHTELVVTSGSEPNGYDGDDNPEVYPSARRRAKCLMLKARPAIVDSLKNRVLFGLGQRIQGRGYVPSYPVLRSREGGYVRNHVCQVIFLLLGQVLY
jgi:hypothetical protein